MEALIELVIVFALGWWLGSRFATMMHLLSFRAILKELNVSNEQLRKLAHKNGLEIPEDGSMDSKDGQGLEVIHIKLEQHQGQIYAFRVDNNGFLAQGTDRESLINHLQQRMTGVRLIVDEGGDLLQKNNTQTG